MKVLLILIVLPGIALGRSAYKLSKKDNGLDNGMYFDPYKPFGTRQHVKEDPYDRKALKKESRYPVKDNYDSSSYESDSYSDEEFSGFYYDDEDYYDENPTESEEQREAEYEAIEENENRIEDLEDELDDKESEIAIMKTKLSKLEHKLTRLEKLVKYQVYEKNSVLSGLKYYNK